MQGTVRDMEILTYSVEFLGCPVQSSVDSCTVKRGSSVQVRFPQWIRTEKWRKTEFQST